LAIESQINPDKQVTSETVRLPAHVAKALREQAIAAGMTLNEYLESLASLDDDRPIEQTESAIEINPEMLAIIDRVEYQWIDLAIAKSIEPKKIFEATAESFDRLMNELIGKFIPSVDRKVANE
jgi:hypothetical protein